MTSSDASMAAAAEQSRAPSPSKDAGHHQEPGQRWEFNASVAGVFEDMLRRSIPQYEVMRKTVFDVGSQFVKPKTDIVDLGSSRGDAIAPFIDKFGARNRFVLAEVSPPMLEILHQRFEGYENTGVVRIWTQDLKSRMSYPPAQASLTLAVLTLMFVPIEHRAGLIGRIFESTVPGGAVVVVEKVLGHTPRTQELLVDLYHAYKRDSGYTQEEIDRKALSLEGALVPVTAHWNEEWLKVAGFSVVECVWRWMSFAAWVAVR